jgi:hypothetical protein
MSSGMAIPSILRTCGSPASRNENTWNVNSRPPRTTPKKRSEQQQHPSKLETISTPGSVLLVNPDMNVSLTRELSDLSGSYLNGTTSNGPGGQTKIPGNVYPSDQSATSYQRPWRHAQVLNSNRTPQHPQPPTNDEMSVGAAINRRNNLDGTLLSDVNLADITNKNDIESMQTMIESVAQSALASFAPNASAKHLRTPLIILLMDPGRKIYELMQLWVDPENDSVRSIVQALQQNLNDNWRQDYDGIFQVRNNHFSQLIHVLSAAKYDVQPFELWVAKPWSMSAKSTVSYAAGLLNHLKRIGVLSYSKSTESDSWKQLMLPSSNQHSNGTSDDTILMLSKQAQQRIHIQGGIMKHHHACQFVSFSPPFEATGTLRVDVLSGELGNDTDAESVPSQLSDSHCGFSMAGESEDNILSLRPPENDSLHVPSSLYRVNTHFSFSDGLSQNEGLPQPLLLKSRSVASIAETTTTASQSPMLTSYCKAIQAFDQQDSSVQNQEVVLIQKLEQLNHRSVPKFQLLSRVFAALCCRCEKAIAIDKSADEHSDKFSMPGTLQIVGFDPTSSRTYVESASSTNTIRNIDPTQLQPWDHEDCAQSADGHSIISESAPLLQAKHLHRQRISRSKVNY